MSTTVERPEEDPGVQIFRMAQRTFRGIELVSASSLIDQTVYSLGRTAFNEIDGLTVAVQKRQATDCPEGDYEKYDLIRAETKSLNTWVVLATIDQTRKLELSQRKHLDNPLRANARQAASIFRGILGAKD